MWSLFRHFTRAARRDVKYVVLALLPFVCGCAVRRKIIPPSQAPGPALSASVTDLLRGVDAWSGKIHTLEAVVDFHPAAGSVYSGVITQYPNVRGYILLDAPATIRIQGQAPVVRTMIFDMVSDGQEFHLYIPSKNKFITGKTRYHGAAKKSLENLRPQHILDALLIPPVDAAKVRYFVEQAEDQAHDYYILSILHPGQGAEMNLQRKFWFDRSDLKLARLQLYGPGGELLEDVSYSGYRDFQDISYPAEIHLRRLPEDYSLGIVIARGTFNLKIPPEKFEMQKPANAEVVQLSESKPAEAPDGR